MPGRTLLRYDAYAAEARLRITEWQTEDNWRVWAQFDSPVAAMRCRRLEAEAERRAVRYLEVPPPPNYSLFE
jgi:hypothetical protein